MNRRRFLTFVGLAPAVAPFGARAALGASPGRLVTGEVMLRSVGAPFEPVAAHLRSGVMSMAEYRADFVAGLASAGSCPEAPQAPVVPMPPSTGSPFLVDDVGSGP